MKEESKIIIKNIDDVNHSYILCDNIYIIPNLSKSMKIKLLLKSKDHFEK